MSLKSFHIVFIIASILLAGGLGYGQFQAYQESQNTLTMFWALLGSISALALLIYLIWFLKKMKRSS